jgi:hypothetical protein
MRTSIIALGAIILSSASLTYANPAAAQGVYLTPSVTTAVAFDESRPVRSMPLAKLPSPFSERELQVRPEEGPFVRPRIASDAVVQAFEGHGLIGAPLLTFEGLANANNSIMVVPPDPNGYVGKTNFVEMVNLVFAVYDKTGHKLAGPTGIGTLWTGFPISDCTVESGDPVVLYDRTNDRWILTQFTTNGPNYWNCVAVSKTGDPAGAYYRYAFAAGPNFPDYPKYSDWSDSYILTSRDFGNAGGYGISVYGLEKKKMVAGNPHARMVHFFLDSAHIPTYLMGDGLLPADVDGSTYPANGAPAPVIGTMNTLGPYGAPFDGLNIYDLTVKWSNPSTSTLTGPTQIHVASFNSTFPCGSGRACIPQPSTSVKIDILSYRQRPTFRLAYRKFPTYETMVTNQSVQAVANRAGVRWYEIRRISGVYSLFQQGTYAPSDSVNRWMGSIAMDKVGNIGLGYSVSAASTVFPGIRYTGRKPTDPAGMMTLHEATLMKGTGSQLTSFNRWGDYSALTLDPADDCTFWYVNEYYQVTSSSGWQTRIGTFKLPNCH